MPTALMRMASARRRSETVIERLPRSGGRVAPLAFDARVATVSDRLVHAMLASTLSLVDAVALIVRSDRHMIDMKSPSRADYKDFGVNRARVERLRERFKTALDQPPAG